jgi:hypothetical protein
MAAGLLVPYHHVLSVEAEIDGDRIREASANGAWLNNVNLLTRWLGERPAGPYQLDFHLNLYLPDEVPFGTAVSKGLTIPRIGEGRYSALFDYPEEYRSLEVRLWKYSEDGMPIQEIDRYKIR